MRRSTRNILSAAWHNRFLTDRQRGELACNLRNAKRFPGFLTVRWSELLGRYVLWTSTYIQPVGAKE